jgi:predicted dehydrogenase
VNCWRICNYSSTTFDSISKNLPIDWRMKNSMAGGGASADINSHLIDLALFLNDDISEVSTIKKTFIDKRVSKNNKVEKVDVDDAINCIVKFNNGSMGVFESSRVCAGMKESVIIEINGTKGAIIYEYQNFNEMKLFIKSRDKENDGFKILKIYDKEYPYMKNWWSEGHGINYGNIIGNQFNDFFLALEEDIMPSPNIYDGFKVQKVMEAMNRSDLEKKWIRVEDL